MLKEGRRPQPGGPQKNAILGCVWRFGGVPGLGGSTAGRWGEPPEVVFGVRETTRFTVFLA